MRRTLIAVIMLVAQTLATTGQADAQEHKQSVRVLVEQWDGASRPRVSLDGSPLAMEDVLVAPGTSASLSVGVAVGDHVVIVTTEGTQPDQRHVRVLEGEEIDLRFHIDRPKRDAPAKGGMRSGAVALLVIGGMCTVIGSGALLLLPLNKGGDSGGIVNVLIAVPTLAVGVPLLIAGIIWAATSH